MAGPALTLASQLMCPHGGTVLIVGTNVAARAGGAPLVTSKDTFTIVGCPFTLPGPKPSPCLSVDWIVTDQAARINGGATLSSGSVGLCKADTGAPQGQVLVLTTQTAMSTR